jgi:hypothetical protein
VAALAVTAPAAWAAISNHWGRITGEEKIISHIFSVILFGGSKVCVDFDCFFVFCLVVPQEMHEHAHAEQESSDHSVEEDF